jgi:hypothetical protein
MQLVYKLSEALARDPETIALTQALTLDLDRPHMGLKGTHGLFGSEEWWENIRQGKIKTRTISGIIKRIYHTGMDPATKPNEMEIILDDGTIVREGIYVTSKKYLPLIIPGNKITVNYVMDELKSSSQIRVPELLSMVESVFIG